MDSVLNDALINEMATRLTFSLRFSVVSGQKERTEIDQRSSTLPSHGTKEVAPVCRLCKSLDRVSTKKTNSKR